MQRSKRIGFECLADGRQLDLQRRRVALGDDAGIVDQTSM
jgi:hypothetical protein